MLKGLSWLVLLQLPGNPLNALWIPVLPGAVIGMLRFFGFPVVRGQVAEALDMAR